MAEKKKPISGISGMQKQAMEKNPIIIIITNKWAKV